jgi:hypothetical protein
MDKSELTTKEAATQLDESERLVRLWCQQGRFPNARRVEHPRGDYWIIPVDDTKNFMKPKPGPVPKSKAVLPTNGATKRTTIKAAQKGMMK